MKPDEMTSWLKTLPNKLTLMRVAVVPIILILFPLDVQGIKVFCAILFGLAAMTDFFDGYLARKYNGVTKMGALLDPISDKVLVTAAIILLTNDNIMPAWIATLIICREIAVSGLRLAAMEQKFTIEVNSFGKWKTAVQDLAIGFLMSSLASWYVPGMVLIWISIGLSYYSAYTYWAKYWELSRSK
ncbi:CDP-diacylglycerol--glycerol-3-phosphate 3-phosphatidyltransferase [Pseudobacteriovorax antillogorgiicola]|uniref:CDP-diacylglycerol--glycerol-3-phosphate 3-phosphatidyltransferase n=2 Tax=Pseudobacteriovorax antillogorgiicola TaxID=1513793 RepID=A0A1Y6BS35_9BACT|nr:CDP-diacylglycerol--glycerol-3-phosphate 3-phosphatidyltransferase [Pseudobacteriovorax antillogorgiicola]TCS53772.1 CDP-diacylglycerol--glycerol-3-phosphate 3-phosphatidyltransferase [Pseudobacteriovorax antillogorgiicola]SMF22443.1 CDP-diacylglycerol--glycerol-3-phosphate 3-phosphatidyltransferase [Pseudobacteriovorax antillogorgiicola]